ncbi:geranylgeranyl diphosphate synthase CrtE [Leptolyngbya sp. NIES-2104]|uniref:geranylgeranyl diphosphate synthase CrtE n=1 Tax=Leptolyngbya sp. NIES-2104 TaxID=1552121 RepID=UPI0006ECCD3E|nr:farnesyl diphosphate synthase [Leptolyngbya sp. NIES-2104]GAP99240.1 octaprenyl diphosphate synthase / dimethylallyltransferase / (2E,6E)-farnesyl diphosphate synthase / geranylgeranyl diphosphate synthase [Leptolyngbya sp. NIES-2104]
MVVTGETQSNQASQFDLKGYLAAKQQQVETALDRAFPVVFPDKIYEAMRYSLFAGGKRLRPVLCLATCDLLGGTPEMAMPTACALEMIHTMSLIHDDLPAMDNDDYRRGKLTNHKVFGEAVAILAGDGLLAYAFEHIVEETKNVPADRLIKVIARLGRAVGAAGLVGGQVVDLDCEGKKDVTLDTLNFIHTHKTAALLEASVVSGGILAGGSDSDIQHLTRYAQAIGLAFQIVDDLLDITSTQEELGKSIGKDMTVEKATYPRLLGMEESRRQAEQLVEQAKAEVAGFGEKAIPLMAIANYITARKN